MIEIIKQILNYKGIDGFKIHENIIESDELFIINKNIDMERAKNVHKCKVTIYKEFVENEIRYKGSSSCNIYPTMSPSEIETSIEDAVIAAGYVKNPYYPLLKGGFEYKSVSKTSFWRKSLPEWMNEISKVLYTDDSYDKGGINSCEIFLNKVYTRIINSEGIDIHSQDYECMIEFITTWKENSEEIELYNCLQFSDYKPEILIDEAKVMIKIAKEKAKAENTPAIGKASIILTRESVKEFFLYYYSQCNAQTVYNGGSTWKIGDKIQGSDVKGDLINMTLDPFMENSTRSRSFDEDGYPLESVNIIENGILKRYIANNRYAYYLNIEPTGTINNIKISGGSYSIMELKKETYLEIAAFSDFTVDDITGDFGGEIRLAWYYDGQNRIPVTGGSITGNIKELHNDIYLSKEIQKSNDFEGPEAIKLLKVKVTGIEKCI